MQALSQPVSSNQHGLHPKLPVLVRRHLRNPCRESAAPYSIAAFDLLERELSAHPRPLVLDSFCGTGHSTVALARSHPRHLVVGIDKSERRLGKHPGGNPTNYLLLRAECADLWQLLAAAGYGVDHHYLLYPNPWPKAKHLQRRIHGNASFPRLLQLGGRLELRSNWQLYVEEFGVAMHLAGLPGRVARVPMQAPISLFERKYRNSGHPLWAFTGHARGLQSAREPE